MLIFLSVHACVCNVGMFESCLYTCLLAYLLVYVCSVCFCWIRNFMCRRAHAVKGPGLPTTNKSCIQHNTCIGTCEHTIHAQARVSTQYMHRHVCAHNTCLGTCEHTVHA